MSEINKEKFVFIEQTENNSEKMYKPSITYWKDAWRRLKKQSCNDGHDDYYYTYLSIHFAPMFSKYNHEDIDLTNTNQAPDSEHIFGTDNVGRDLW